MDHTQAPVLDALRRHHERGEIAFTPPGHKQGRGADPEARATLGDAVYHSDLLASGGLDDRRTSGEVLVRAERLMADAVHAEHTYFTTCGSSLSVKAAMLAVAGPSEKLIVGRDAHKSVISGLIVSGIEPVWVDPQWDEEQCFAHAPGPEAFEEALTRHPDARGALVTSPTPYGSCAALNDIAEIFHARGLPVVVDEAWGAHLPFHPELPSWAMDAGADVCVTSIHKMGSGLEQGSVYHLQGSRIEADTLRARADLFGTTSPSVLIYAGLDAWRRQMVLHGKGLLDHALRLASQVRAAVDEIPGLHVLGHDHLVGPGLSPDFDPLPVVIDVSGLGTSGYRAADWLRGEHHLDMHLVDHRRISAQLTHADSTATTQPLLDALRDLAAHAAEPVDGRPVIDVPSGQDMRMEQTCRPRDAYFGPARAVPLEHAAGCVSAEMITPYPPGIPAVLPGERLTEPVLRYLRTGLRAGMNLPDASDAELRTVRVRV
ncbi:aminotransferase class I/II-fold pyridoxal phosphate-dependent enzyme [Streptomyces sporangiiformans]|uniref:Ornithine decarboxylase n=1 Tax=Streptomyces sporangiiformans TaxID=2315329 RepID=A0A505DJK2_9ACTN|nr:ornithine decarboxylase [Streptomyces sporangiiformans]TPQ18739.1 ornithine decarboxylase [Streptomyces sporangiiformans]